MSLREHELDLIEQVSSKQEKLDNLLEEQEYVEDEARDIDPDSEEYTELESEWEDLQEDILTEKGEIFKFKEAVVHWANEDLDLNDLDQDEYRGEIEKRFKQVDESVITVRELTYGQVQRVRDDMMEESFNVDIQNEDIEGSPRSGFYQIELLKEAIIDWPEYAPVSSRRGKVEKPSPADYPVPVSEWVYEKVDNFNTIGEAEMGNSSLEEALNSSR